MEYRKYTPQSPLVSAMGMGTWQLGVGADWQAMPEQEAIRMVEVALDEGVNFFDTAPNYGQGTSELRLGRALKSTDRSRVVLNTKFGHTVEGQLDFEPDAIRVSVEGSLRRLQVDYLDSALFHNPPKELLDGNRASAHYELLERLVAEGKIRAYGASLDTWEEMKVFLDTTNGSVIEAFFNILHQGTARAFGQAQAAGVALIAKIPLDSGWLSGKYGPDSTFDGVRSRWSRSDIAQRAALVAEVEELLGADFQLPEAALAFCLAPEVVSTVIPGSTSLEQLRSNIRSLDKPLPAALVGQLRAFYEAQVRPLNLPW
ncbi:MAG: aldo/keto reductase [Phaeodactylibacter sp.]|uniref:aldo/keto reductase n=1 Tax=Phaeodactylibacter sp. TaxID=1940289 RepID=UPI0032EBBC5C